MAAIWHFHFDNETPLRVMNDLTHIFDVYQRLFAILQLICAAI